MCPGKLTSWDSITGTSLLSDLVLGLAKARHQWETRWQEDSVVVLSPCWSTFFIVAALYQPFRGQHFTSDFSSPNSSNTASSFGSQADNDFHPLLLPGCFTNLCWSPKLAKTYKQSFLKNLSIYCLSTPSISCPNLD